VIEIHNPAELPPVNKIQAIREPIIRANILTPEAYIGNIMTLCIEKRGVQKQVQYILINGERVDALSIIVHRDNAEYRGRELASKMKELIPRQMFDVAIQAAIGSNIIARTNVKALRKNVTAKCYGGDVTRKKKLLEKQKAGKKRMKQVGKVEIPQDAFLAVLQVDNK